MAARVRDWLSRLKAGRREGALPDTGQKPESWNLMDIEQRNRYIALKLNEGLSLAEVQRVLADEHGVSMTYLDLRLLAAELEVDWKKHDKEKPAPTPEAAALQEPEAPEPKTKVTLSKLVRPGASMSGDVEFASGGKAEWYLDAYGRLGLNPAEGSPKPTEQDLREFQAELQRKLTGQT